MKKKFFVFVWILVLAGVSSTNVFGFSVKYDFTGHVTEILNPATFNYPVPGTLVGVPVVAGEIFSGSFIVDIDTPPSTIHQYYRQYDAASGFSLSFQNGFVDKPLNEEGSITIQNNSNYGYDAYRFSGHGPNPEPYLTFYHSVTGDSGSFNTSATWIDLKDYSMLAFDSTELPVHLSLNDFDEISLGFSFISWDFKNSTWAVSVQIKGVLDTLNSTIIDPLDAILTFFDASVADGELEGDGPGNSANGRLNALRNMLEMAGDLISIGDIEGACGQLRAASGKCDGERKPPDFVAGPAASELCTMITELMTELGCE